MRSAARLRTEQAMRLRRHCLVLASRRLDGFIGCHDALVALEDLDVEQDPSPACQVGLHESVIVLLNLRKYVPLAHLMQLVLHSLDYLPHNEVLVDKHEEETLEQGVNAEEPERRHRNKDLRNEFAEELGFV